MKPDAAAWRSRWSYPMATLAGMVSDLQLDLPGIDRVATFSLLESFDMLLLFSS